MKAFRIIVQGNVQGVFFRASAKEKAAELEIAGFVRNQPNGSVYIEAEGKEDCLHQFLTWCHHGPPHAHVTTLDVQEIGVKNYENFQIRR